METVRPRSNWTFVTNHARILAMILRDPEIRLRDLANACRLTERAAQAIVTDLENAGYLTRARHGRRNHYDVTPGTLFRHPAEGNHEIADLLHLLVGLGQETQAPLDRETLAPLDRETPAPSGPKTPARPSPGPSVPLDHDRPESPSARGG
ncbi:MarR family transcriptional regulator [Streptomyces sp. NPDC046275]|uniref:helix-turn-helix transcriptional regulator n=1 Tax=Streptomyces sp. NPDC046275 TaxID=3157201 RepID=UPI0033F93A8F